MVSFTRKSISFICPWASRTLIALRLKGLESVISVCVLDPRLSDQGWRFSGEAVARVFATLDWLEDRLSQARWLVGEQLTETDIRAFVTLIRFDLAYYGLFKCNLRPLSAYPSTLNYLTRLLDILAFAASVRIDHIKAGYYSIKALNPTGVVPAGPQLDYLRP